ADRHTHRAADARGARHRSPPFRYRADRQHGDRVSDAAARPEPLRPVEHRQGPHRRDDPRCRAVRCSSPLLSADRGRVSRAVPVAAERRLWLSQEMSDTPRQADFDADVPEDFDSPHAMFKDLRGRCPVAYSDAMGGFWAVTKYADIVRVLTDWQTFTTTIQNVVPRVATTQRRPPLHLDPPGNVPYRTAITRMMTPARLKPWRAKIEKEVDELLAPLLDRGEGDICRDFSFVLPIAVLADFFRLPEENARRIRIVGAEFNMALQRRDDENVRKYSDELYRIASELIEDRKAHPQ